MDLGMYGVNSYPFLPSRPNTKTQRYDFVNSNLGFHDKISSYFFCESCGASDHDSTDCHLTPSHLPLRPEPYMQFQDQKLEDFILRYERDLEKLTGCFEYIVNSLLKPHLSHYTALLAMVGSLNIRVDELTTQNQKLQEQIVALVDSKLHVEPTEVHHIEECTTIVHEVKKVWDGPDLDRKEFSQVSKEDPMIYELKVFQSSTPTPTIITSCEVKAISETKGRRKELYIYNLCFSYLRQNANSAPTPFSSPRGLSRLPLGIISTGYRFPLKLETLLSAAERRRPSIEAPAVEVQYRVSLIIDNLYSGNIEAKAKELNEVLTEQYFPWFAQYLVVQRASIESNCNELFLKNLEEVNSRALCKVVLETTYENCKVLLASELIKSSSEERTLLRNLSSWLGKVTIGRNQALRTRDIDPKSLILEGYEKGSMIAVIPFTCKILQGCRSSLAFQPPNPWTMAILSLLAEIYAMPYLKMSLKFEIEELFGNLGVNMQYVAPTSLLKDRVRVSEDNPDFNNPSHPTIG